MAYVFILCDHDESGAENVVATLHRSLLPAMLRDNWPDEPWPSYADREGLRDLEPVRAEALASLEPLLARTDEELAQEGKYVLNEGWGSIQLHVVKLAGMPDPTDSAAAWRAAVAELAEAAVGSPLPPEVDPLALIPGMLLLIAHLERRIQTLEGRT